MARKDGELLQGTLGLVIMKALLHEEMHGYAIARYLEAVTEDVLRIEEGSLYPALRRLEDRGWVQSRWAISDTNRRARFYALTRAGKTQLRAEATTWQAFSRAITVVLRTVPAVI